MFVHKVTNLATHYNFAQTLKCQYIFFPKPDSELDVKDEPDEDEDDNRDSGGTGTINDLESRLQVDAVKIEEDSADDADESEENTSSGDEESKAGLASVFADILRKKATSKTVILSKGDTDKQIAKRKRLKEQKDEDGEAPYKYAHLNLSEQQAKVGRQFIYLFRVENICAIFNTSFLFYANKV